MAIKDKAKIYTVYLATFGNGKVYVGVTGTSLEERAKRHGHFHKSKLKQKMYRAIMKYGKESITWTVLITTKDKNEAIEKEKYFIKTYNSKNHDFGYNLTSGGDGCLDLERPYERDYYIDNFGNIFHGGLAAADFHGIKAHVVQNSARKDRVCEDLGYRLYFSKYIDGMLCALPRVKPERHKKIEDITNGICFYSARDAANFHNINYNFVRRVAVGDRNSTCNLKFRFI
jgi:predicted GIY-YIG superfamily endonuclease